MEILLRNLSEITFLWNRSPANNHGISEVIVFWLNFDCDVYTKNKLSFSEIVLCTKKMRSVFQMLSCQIPGPPDLSIQLAIKK